MVIRVGLIGCGYAGHTFHAPLIRATPGLELVAVASRDPARVHAALGAGIEVSTPDALPARADIDLVVIATPNQTHHPLAREALAAGRHVVVDKPFALDAVQAEQLVALARERGRLLSVFHNRRWDSDFLTLCALLRDGRLGRPVQLVSSFDRFRPQVRDRWREGAGPGAGVWLDLGPHLLDQAVRLFGPPSALAVELLRQRDGALADDAFCARLRWDGGPHAGLRVQLQASMLAARPAPRFVLHGTGGSFVVEGLDAQEEALKQGAAPERIAGPDWGLETREATLVEPAADGSLHERPLVLQRGAYPAYYAGVRNALRGEAPNPVPPEQALVVQRLLDAGFASARERRELAFSA